MTRSARWGLAWLVPQCSQPYAVREPGPYLLNVRVLPFENVYPMVPAGGAINEMVLGPAQPVGA